MVRCMCRLHPAVGARGQFQRKTTPQHALISAYRVTGAVGDNLVLPCSFPISKEANVICWGWGSCSTLGCNNPLTRVEAGILTWKKSSKYEFTGKTEEGQASLEISDVTLDDSGTYCCRVKAKTGGFDVKIEVNVEIQQPLMPNNLVRGSVDNTLTLPCKYSTKDGSSPMCWGRGKCGLTGCPNEILTTDSEKVTSSGSERYQLRGNILDGDVSLTINGVFKDDEGTYCCRVKIPGPFNDIKKDVGLQIEDVTLVRGSLTQDLTLPCSYATDSGRRPTCWGKGHCGLVTCFNKVLETDGDAVTWRKGNKYQLNKRIMNGDVALTIKDVNEHDGGVYCCRVKVQGAFNDIKKEIRLQIHDSDRVKGVVGKPVKLPCSYNVSEGTTKMCWGRGHCPTFKCKDTIAWTEGDTVSVAEFKKYKMEGKLEYGDVSLTILDVTKEDEGDYCCRVQVPGLFNDQEKEISLEVQEDDILIHFEQKGDGAKILQTMNPLFETKDLGSIKNYLSIQIERAKDGSFLLNQKYKVQVIIETFGMEDAEPVKSPVETNYLTEINSQETALPTNTHCQLVIAGCIKYSCYQVVQRLEDVVVLRSVLAAAQLLFVAESQGCKSKLAGALNMLSLVKEGVLYDFQETCNVQSNFVVNHFPTAANRNKT
ncbi:polymeric immunoglobulin receptor-like [Gastrophryne carolinensis]